MKTILVCLLCLVPTLVWAQIDPYHPPVPGWVLIQPCGSEPGWVPPTHPLASTPPCQTGAATSAGPWTTATDQPLAFGKVYTDPYQRVLVVVGMSMVLSHDGQQQIIVRTGQGLLYQSVTMWQENRQPWFYTFDASQPRGLWWEIATILR